MLQQLFCVHVLVVLEFVRVLDSEVAVVVVTGLWILLLVAEFAVMIVILNDE